jgi:CubicO group peptidase (beta-lactamase class C family)
MEDLKVTANGYDFKPAQAAMQRYVDNNLLSGISWAVMVGRDLVDVNCVGWADKEAQTPLRTDHIFRVFSNTKLITSCAALLLFEEGKLKLDDPIEKLFRSSEIERSCARAQRHLMTRSRRRARSPSVSS